MQRSMISWMQEEQMSSSSHASIMREAHACSFCEENDDLNKAKKLLLALSFVLAFCLCLDFCGQAFAKCLVRVATYVAFRNIVARSNWQACLRCVIAFGFVILVFTGCFAQIGVLV